MSTHRNWPITKNYKITNGSSQSVKCHYSELQIFSTYKFVQLSKPDSKFRIMIYYIIIIFLYINIFHNKKIKNTKLVFFHLNYLEGIINVFSGGSVLENSHKGAITI